MSRRTQKRSVVAGWLRVDDVALRGAAPGLERELALEHPDLWEEVSDQPHARFMCSVCDNVVFEMSDATYVATHLTWDGSPLVYQSPLQRLADLDEVRIYMGGHACMPEGVVLPDDWRDQVAAAFGALKGL